MTSLGNADSSFDGVSGGKINPFVTPLSVSRPVNKVRRFFILTALCIVALGASVASGWAGTTKGSYDFGSAEYVSRFESHITLTCWFLIAVALLAVIAYGILSKRAMDTFAVVTVTLFAVLCSVMVGLSSNAPAKGSLENWITTNEKLTIFTETGNPVSSSIISRGFPFLLVNEDNNLVRGKFTEKSEGKYVFSLIPLPPK